MSDARQAEKKYSEDKAATLPCPVRPPISGSLFRHSFEGTAISHSGLLYNIPPWKLTTDGGNYGSLPLHQPRQFNATQRQLTGEQTETKATGRLSSLETKPSRVSQADVDHSHEENYQPRRSVEGLPATRHSFAKVLARNRPTVSFNEAFAGGDFEQDIMSSEKQSLKYPSNARTGHVPPLLGSDWRSRAEGHHTERDMCRPVKKVRTDLPEDFKLPSEVRCRPSVPGPTTPKPSETDTSLQAKLRPRDCRPELPFRQILPNSTFDNSSQMPALGRHEGNAVDFKFALPFPPRSTGFDPGHKRAELSPDIKELKKGDEILSCHTERLVPSALSCSIGLRDVQGLRPTEDPTAFGWRKYSHADTTEFLLKLPPIRNAAARDATLVSGRIDRAQLLSMNSSADLNTSSTDRTDNERSVNVALDETKRVNKKEDPVPANFLCRPEALFTPSSDTIELDKPSDNMAERSSQKDNLGAILSSGKPRDTASAVPAQQSVTLSDIRAHTELGNNTCVEHGKRLDPQPVQPGEVKLVEHLAPSCPAGDTELQTSGAGTAFPQETNCDHPEQVLIEERVHEILPCGSPSHSSQYIADELPTVPSTMSKNDFSQPKIIDTLQRSSPRTTTLGGIPPDAMQTPLLDETLATSSLSPLRPENKHLLQPEAPIHSVIGKDAVQTKVIVAELSQKQDMEDTGSSPLTPPVDKVIETIGNDVRCPEESSQEKDFPALPQNKSAVKTRSDVDSYEDGDHQSTTDLRQSIHTGSLTPVANSTRLQYTEMMEVIPEDDRKKLPDRDDRNSTPSNKKETTEEVMEERDTGKPGMPSIEDEAYAADEVHNTATKSTLECTNNSALCQGPQGPGLQGWQDVQRMPVFTESLHKRPLTNNETKSENPVENSDKFHADYTGKDQLHQTSSKIGSQLETRTYPEESIAPVIQSNDLERGRAIPELKTDHLRSSSSGPVDNLETVSGECDIPKAKPTCHTSVPCKFQHDQPVSSCRVAAARSGEMHDHRYATEYFQGLSTEGNQLDKALATLPLNQRTEHHDTPCHPSRMTDRSDIRSAVQDDRSDIRSAVQASVRLNEITNNILLPRTTEKTHIGLVQDNYALPPRPTKGQQPSMPQLPPDSCKASISQSNGTFGNTLPATGHVALTETTNSSALVLKKSTKPFSLEFASELQDLLRDERKTFERNMASVCCVDNQQPLVDSSHVGKTADTSSVACESNALGIDPGHSLQEEEDHSATVDSKAQSNQKHNKKYVLTEGILMYQVIAPHPPSGSKGHWVKLDSCSRSTVLNDIEAIQLANVKDLTEFHVEEGHGSPMISKPRPSFEDAQDHYIRTRSTVKDVLLTSAASPAADSLLLLYEPKELSSKSDRISSNATQFLTSRNTIYQLYPDLEASMYDNSAPEPLVPYGSQGASEDSAVPELECELDPEPELEPEPEILASTDMDVEERSSCPLFAGTSDQSERTEHSIDLSASLDERDDILCSEGSTEDDNCAASSEIATEGKVVKTVEESHPRLHNTVSLCARGEDDHYLRLSNDDDARSRGCEDVSLVPVSYGHSPSDGSVTSENKERLSNSACTISSELEDCEATDSDSHLDDGQNGQATPSTEPHGVDCVSKTPSAEVKIDESYEKVMEIYYSGVKNNFKVVSTKSNQDVLHETPADTGVLRRPLKSEECPTASRNMTEMDASPGPDRRLRLQEGSPVTLCKFQALNENKKDPEVNSTGLLGIRCKASRTYLTGDEQERDAGPKRKVPRLGLPRWHRGRPLHPNFNRSVPNP